jgi:hypothetical protein
MARKFPFIYYGTRMFVRAITGPRLRLLNRAHNQTSSLFKTQYNTPSRLRQDLGPLLLYSHVSEWISSGVWI